MKRLFLFLFAAILGITQVWGLSYTFTTACGTGCATAYICKGSSFSGTSTQVLDVKKGDYSVQATGESGYTFEYWEAKEGTSVKWTSTSETATITVTDNYPGNWTITAYYKSNSGGQGGGGGGTTPKYVDLGLPSGTLWATCNLGAASETVSGNYYAFGEKDPKQDYSTSTSTFTQSNSLQKYYSNYIFVDGTMLLKDDCDAAYQETDEGVWRTPTKAEVEELFKNCNCTAVTGGVKFANKNDATKYIIIPTAGRKRGTSAPEYTNEAYIWTRSYSKYQYPNEQGYAAACTNGGSVSEQNAPNGLPIRPIFVPKDSKIKATFKKSADDASPTVKDVTRYASITAPIVTRDATAAKEYTFKEWSPVIDNTHFISVPTTFTASWIESDRKYTVNFAAADGNKGNPSKASGSYTYKAKITDVTVTPAPGYEFDCWKKGDEVVDLDTFKVTADGIILTAYFKEVTALTLVDDKNAGDSWYTWLGGCVGEDKILDVTYNRTFPAGTTAEPSWSVFSLPFNYFIEDAGATFADKVLNMDHATYDGEILSIYCTYETLKIEANRPYILYNTGAEIVNPVFAGVTVKALAENSYYKPCTGGGTVTFKNTTCYQQLPENNKNILFIGNNQLYYPGDATYLRAFRGYFVLDGVRPDSAPKRVRLMVNETTGLESNMQNEQQSATEKVVENGALYIIRNGVRYDARGAEIR